MRKPQASGRGPDDRIVLRTARPAKVRTSPTLYRRPGTVPATRTLGGSGRGEATMDYQMGFTSGPSN
jgi:hypothetical protein